MTSINNTRPIFPDYRIYPFADKIAFKTFLRKKHRGKYYFVPIEYIHYSLNMESGMKVFVSDCYAWIMLGKVNTNLKHHGIPLHELDTNQIDEYTRLTTTP